MNSNRWMCLFLNGLLVLLMYPLVTFCNLPGWVALVAYGLVFIGAGVYDAKASKEEKEISKLKQRVKKLEKKLGEENEN